MPRKKKSEILHDLLKDVLVDEPVIHKDDDIIECEILVCFRDKYTNKLYEVGKTYKFTYKRVKEIKAKNEKYLKELN